MSRMRYEIFCGDCGEPRNILQERCYVCGALQQFTEFEKALAEFEGSSRFNQAFAREFREATQ